MLQTASLLPSSMKCAPGCIMAEHSKSSGKNISPSSYIAAGLAMLQSSPAGAPWAVNRCDDGQVNGVSLNATPWADWVSCLAIFWGSAYTPETSHLNLSQLVPAASATTVEDRDAHGRRQICPATLWSGLLLYALVAHTPAKQLTQESWIVSWNCLGGWSSLSRQLYDAMTPFALFEDVDLITQLP